VRPSGGGKPGRGREPPPAAKKTEAAVTAALRDSRQEDGAEYQARQQASDQQQAQRRQQQREARWQNFDMTTWAAAELSALEHRIEDEVRPDQRQRLARVLKEW